MRLVVLGLSLSSSWGNGHATTWRALLAALARRGHDILFLERDQPWYSAARDLTEPDFCRLAFYDGVADLDRFAGEIANADAVLLGSYVPDGVAVGRLVQRVAGGVRAFYDIDTPVTLARLAGGDREYFAPELVPDFDVYFSFSAGRALDELRTRYGARAPRALYCAVDAEAYRPVETPLRWDLGYLGTYSEDRQPALERLLIEPARRLPHRRFVVAGPQYPDLDWPANVERLDHLPPSEHPAFYSAMRYTLNVTRADMVRLGHSPSVRLFEAAACGTPVISDDWPGLGEIFAPEGEIIIAATAEQVTARLEQTDEAMRREIGRAARARVLSEHTAGHRAATVEREIGAAARRRAGAAAERLGA